MPKDVEKCVADIQGINKRTGKPYTKSEKWAICTAMHQKKGKAEFNISEFTEQQIDEIFAQVDKSMNLCVDKMMKSGRAKTTDEAKAKCEAMMSKADFDLDQLEFVLTKIL